MSFLAVFAIGLCGLLSACVGRALWFFWKGWRMYEQQERVSEREAADNGAPLASGVLSVAPRSKQSKHRAHRGF